MKEDKIIKLLTELVDSTNVVAVLDSLEELDKKADYIEINTSDLDSKLGQIIDLLEENNKLLKKIIDK